MLSEGIRVRLHTKGGYWSNFDATQANKQRKNDDNNNNNNNNNNYCIIDIINVNININDNKYTKT